MYGTFFPQYLCEPSDCFPVSGLQQQKFHSLMMHWVFVAGYGHFSIKARSPVETGPWVVTLKRRKWPLAFDFFAMLFLCALFRVPAGAGCTVGSRSWAALCWSHPPPQHPKRLMVCWLATPAPVTRQQRVQRVGEGLGRGLSSVCCRKCHRMGQRSHFCRQQLNCRFSSAFIKNKM